MKKKRIQGNKGFTVQHSIKMFDCFLNKQYIRFIYKFDTMYIHILVLQISGISFEYLINNSITIVTDLK